MPLIIKKKIRHTKLQCNYKFVKGVNSGCLCKNPVVIGFSKCKEHIKHQKHKLLLITKIEKSVGNSLDINVYKNEFNEWEDYITGFIFDRDTGKVIKQRTNDRELKAPNIFDIYKMKKLGLKLEVNEENHD